MHEVKNLSEEKETYSKDILYPCSDWGKEDKRLNVRAFKMATWGSDLQI